MGLKRFLLTWIRINIRYPIASWLWGFNQKELGARWGVNLPTNRGFLGHKKKVELFIPIFFSTIFFLIFLESSETCAKKMFIKIRANIFFCFNLITIFLHTVQMILKKWFPIKNIKKFSEIFFYYLQKRILNCWFLFVENWCPKINKSKNLNNFLNFF